VLHDPRFQAGSVPGRCQPYGPWRSGWSATRRQSESPHPHAPPSPQTYGLAERFNRALEYEHVCQCEIEQVAELAEEVAAYLVLYNEITPHEALGQKRPLLVHRGDSHLFRG
jgi:transposase InsO family protein